MEVDIILGWPPSVNKVWKYGGGTVRSQKAVKDYYMLSTMLHRRNIKATMMGRICVQVLVYPPDKRQRDLDNILKVPMDAMQKIGVYKNDSQIDELHVYRKEISKNNARLVINLREI